MTHDAEADQVPVDRARLMDRLERDIAWLKRHNLWTRSLFERAVARYVEANGSTADLDAFVTRHGADAWFASSHQSSDTNAH
jgi:hypothetical protein